MIAPLRRRHRQMAIGMAVVIPSVFAAALVARRTPAVDAVPFATEPTLGRVVIAAQGVVSGIPVSAAVDPTGVLRISPAGPLRQPGLLLYWTAGALSSSDSLPRDAILLGPVSGERAETFRLPSARNNRAGQLLFFSLGHAQTVGSIALPPGSAR
jgi:hypothetical protein